jgi:hypothetical protein
MKKFTETTEWRDTDYEPAEDIPLFLKIKIGDQHLITFGSFKNDAYYTLNLLTNEPHDKPIPIHQIEFWCYPLEGRVLH